jgi:hypothetical protein
MKEDSEEETKYHYHYHHGSNILLAVILIIAGIIFLLNNFGILPWQIWNLIWRFWPLALVLWGLQIIFGKSFLGRLVVTLVGLALVAFVIAFAIASVSPAFSQWLSIQLPWWNWEILNKFEIPNGGY